MTVIGYKNGESEVHEEWLVFSRPVSSDGLQAGHVEIAFQVENEQSKCQRIRRVEHSPLVVFFPTAVETSLGFFVQGPYRTTTNRENVPEHDEWNKRLVAETILLLVESLRWLRDQNRLNTDVLRCLPLRSGQPLFTSLFDATKEVLSTEPLLPRFDGGYVPAAHALLGRTGELHNLFSPDQLLVLYERKHKPVWLSSEITADREPVLRRYLMQELNVPEVTPELIIQKLNQVFLEAQTDDWIQRFYEFLDGRSGLRWRLANIPLIRLEDGSHVTPKVDGQPRAFLPSENKTDFPTVRGSVCASEEAVSFLKSLELEEPNPVDDVIRHILPRYQGDSIDITDANYTDDIERVLDAYNTDSKKQQDKLIEALKKTRFVRSVDSGNGSKGWSTPGDVYLPTDRLRRLLNSIGAVFFVDDSYACLGGKPFREMMEVSGAARHLRLIQYYREDLDIWGKELSQLRKQAGQAETSGHNDRLLDCECPELNDLLALLSTLPVEERRTQTMLLWEELIQLKNRRGEAVFAGRYSWHYHRPYNNTCDAAFVSLLNNSKWVPDTEGNLQRPQSILFDSLGWEADPFLESKIRFKPPIIEQLAQEVGIEPEVLDIIKGYALTKEKLAELIAHHEPEEISDSDHIDPAPTDPNPRPRPIPRARSQTTDPTTYEERMEIEEKAIKLILIRERGWQRTATNNPGYDLYKADEQEQKTHWCEVKSISDSLEVGELHL